MERFIFNGVIYYKKEEVIKSLETSQTAVDNLMSIAGDSEIKAIELNNKIEALEKNILRLSIANDEQYAKSFDQTMETTKIITELVEAKDKIKLMEECIKYLLTIIGDLDDETKAFMNDNLFGAVSAVVGTTGYIDSNSAYIKSVYNNETNTNRYYAKVRLDLRPDKIIFSTLDLQEAEDLILYLNGESGE